MHFGAGGAKLAKIAPRVPFSCILELGAKPSQNSSQDIVFYHFGAGAGKPSKNRSQDTVLEHFGAGGNPPPQARNILPRVPAESEEGLNNENQ